MSMWKDVFETYKSLDDQDDVLYDPSEKKDDLLQAGSSDDEPQKPTLHIIAFLESPDGSKQQLSPADRVLALELKVAAQEARIKQLEAIIENLKASHLNKKSRQSRNNADNEPDDKDNQEK